MQKLTCASFLALLTWGLIGSLPAADPNDQSPELSPPTFEFDVAVSAPSAKLSGVTASFTAAPAPVEQNIVNDLMDLRSRIGGVSGSSSRFQAELVRLIDAERQRSADAGAASSPVVNLSAAAAEPPKPTRLHAQSAADPGAPPSSSRRTALQIAMYRALAEELDGLANQLEREDSYTAADVLRQRSLQLREQARRLWTSFPAAREALRELPTANTTPPIDLNQPPAAASLPSVPAPIPDPPERQPKAKK